MGCSLRSSRGRRTAWGVATLSGLLAAGPFTTACRPPAEQGPIDFQAPVSVAPATVGTVEEWIRTAGALTAEHSVRLYVETSGVLEVARGAGGTRLAEGDRVRRGQLVATVAGIDVRLQAMTEANRQRFEERRTHFESSERLFAAGLISREALARARTDLAQAELELERSLRTEERGRLTTPIAGVLLSVARDAAGRPVADGQLVERGFEVAEIAPVGSLVAEVDLVGADIARVQPGVPARVRHPAWNGASFPGRVRRLAPTVDPRTRTLRAEVVIDNGEGVLRPGMYVEVDLLVERRPDVLTIAERAVVERGGRPGVFVLSGQRVELRPVVLGLAAAGRVEVVSGLREGERVVVEGQETLSDGSRVQATES